jgi:hypothetical protein
MHAAPQLPPLLLQDLNFPKEIPDHWGRLVDATPFDEWNPDNENETRYIANLLQGLRCKQYLHETGSDNSVGGMVWDGWRTLVVSGKLTHPHLWEKLKTDNVNMHGACDVFFVNASAPHDHPRFGEILRAVTSSLVRGEHVVVFSTGDYQFLGFLIAGITLLKTQGSMRLSDIITCWKNTLYPYDFGLNIITSDQWAYLEGLGDGAKIPELKIHSIEDAPMTMISHRGGEYIYHSFRSDNWLNEQDDSVLTGTDLVFKDEHVLNAKNSLLYAIKQRDIGDSYVYQAIESLICATLKATLCCSSTLMNDDTGDGPL